MRSDEVGKAASRAWLRNEQRTGSREAWPVVSLGLLAIALAVAQAWCVANLLAGALLNRPGDRLPLLAGFVGLALARACLLTISDRKSFKLGAAARRRLRTDALSRLLHAGPAALRTQHTGELTT